MEQLQLELDRLVAQHYRVEKVNTHRHDQWFKRSLKSWNDWNPEIPLTVLAPRESVETWGTKILRFAETFGHGILKASRRNSFTQTQQSSFEPSDRKLFPDTGLDEDVQNPIRSAITPNRPMLPVMQRLSFWTTSVGDADEFVQRAEAVRTLLVCRQVDALLFLADAPARGIRNSAREGVSRTDKGWLRIVDEVLEVLCFLSVILCFEEEFITKRGYKGWVLHAFYHGGSVVDDYVGGWPNGELPTTPQDLQREVDRCYGILRDTERLVSKCGLEPIDWKMHFTNMFLQVCGFEAWNRYRHGQGYLHCSLNVVKEAAWLQKHAGNGLTGDEAGARPDHDATQAEEPKPPKRWDPLKLRESRGEPTPSQSQESEEALEELAALEAEEAEYGYKRSPKYQRRKPGKPSGTKPD